MIIKSKMQCLPKKHVQKTKYSCDKYEWALCISHFKYVCESCLSKKHNNNDDDDYDEV